MRLEEIADQLGELGETPVESEWGRGFVEGMACAASLLRTIEDKELAAEFHDYMARNA